MATNPRWKSGRRKKYKARFKAIQAPCGICRGQLGPIDYSTSDPHAPLGFVIDEIIPVSKWKQAGYDSPAAAADDWNNLQPAHRICNQMKGNKLNYTFSKMVPVQKKNITSDGEW